MRPLIALASAIMFFMIAGCKKESSINREALVNRHQVTNAVLDDILPLGNGKFCFGTDGTGLQSFGGNIMSDWSWHNYPLPEGATRADVPETGTIETGKLTAPMKMASAKEDVSNWMFRNPHRYTMGRIRFVRPDGSAFAKEDINIINRNLDLWNGVHHSEFTIDQTSKVKVNTSVHPEKDIIAFQVESDPIGNDGLSIELSFPYPMDDKNLREKIPWHGHWDMQDRHTTIPDLGKQKVVFSRVIDETRYLCTWMWNDKDAEIHTSPDGHSFILSSFRPAIEFTLSFFEEAIEGQTSNYSDIENAASLAWMAFWNSGGAIDLSKSKDPRWKELERRIVLSQYLFRTQSAGLWPPSELSLMGVDPWSTQFHMEMVWWHMAHYGLWDRWHFAEKPLSCYQKFLPVARNLAAQFGYIGAKWGKQVGPEGRTAPWDGSFLLHWQQPHPIFFAEMAYRLDPSKETLEKWGTIVIETADYMADFPTFGEDGLYHLTPVRTANENGDGTDPAFELAYWKWAMDIAKTWRKRLNMNPDEKWDNVLTNLAPLPQNDSLYLFCQGWTDTYSELNEGHPDPLGPVAFLPLTTAVDSIISANTVQKIYREWQWDKTWGWDFPWGAMAAARMGQPETAIEILLKDVKRNSYFVNGINEGWYFPGNGGLLYAVAMMAAGWEGAPLGNAPGFPNDGSWTVKWEGLNKAF